MKHSLIVSANAKTIAFLRERYLGDEWFVTDTPSEAIAALAKEPFDRVFLDHWLEQEPANGRDVSLWLGAHPEHNPRVQVIAMTQDAKKGNQMVAECGRVAYWIPIEQIMALGA
jgi:CheY-like chemotaxis protein